MTSSSKTPSLAPVAQDLSVQPQYETCTDEELVAAYLGGDQAAFGAIIRRYEDRLYRLSFRMLGNHHDASDAVQEVLLKLIAALPKFEGRSRFGTFLYRLTSNTCLDFRRKRGRKSAESLDAAIEGKPVAALGMRDDQSADNPEVWVEMRYRESLLRAAMGQLTKSYRKLLELRDLEDLPNSQVAAQLGIEVGTMKSRLHRARRALRRILEAGVMVPGYGTVAFGR